MTIFIKAPPYSMNSADYSIITGLRGVVSILATTMLIIIQKYDFNDYLVILIALTSTLVQNIIYGVSQTSIWLYIGTFAGGGAHVTVPILRKMLAERVDESLYGSLYTIPAWIESGGNAIGKYIILCFRV